MLVVRLTDPVTDALGEAKCDHTRNPTFARRTAIFCTTKGSIVLIGCRPRTKQRLNVQFHVPRRTKLRTREILEWIWRNKSVPNYAMEFEGPRPFFVSVIFSALVMRNSIVPVHFARSRQVGAAHANCFCQSPAAKVGHSVWRLADCLIYI